MANGRTSRLVVALGTCVLSGCGDQSVGPTATTAVIERADVSILYPLAESMAAIEPMIRPSEDAAYGPLFPERWFPTNIGAVDIGLGYADLRLVGLRLDPCSARGGCTSEIRVIYQPVIAGTDGRPTVGDGAIHVFYAVPIDELVDVMNEILTAKASFGDSVDYGDELGVQPILAATGLEGDYASELRRIVLAHLGESRVERFTERNHQIPLQDRWDFYLFEPTGTGEFAQQTIATTATIEQQLTGTAFDASSAGGVVEVSPALDDPAILAVIDANRPAEPTDAIRAAFQRAIELQDPRRETSESIDCVSCHVAEGARRVGTAEYGLVAGDEPGIIGSLGYRRDVVHVNDLLMFAYDGRYVSVSQRVSNESALTATAFRLLQ